MQRAGMPHGRSVVDVRCSVPTESMDLICACTHVLGDSMAFVVGFLGAHTSHTHEHTEIHMASTVKATTP